MVVLPLIVVGVWAFAAAWAVAPPCAHGAHRPRGRASCSAGGPGGRARGASCSRWGIAVASAAVQGRPGGGLRGPGHLLSTSGAGGGSLSLRPWCRSWVPSTVFAMGVQVAFIRAGLAYSSGRCGALARRGGAPLLRGDTMVDVTHAAGTRLEDAARTLGAGRLRTLLHVTLPAVAPGLGVVMMSMGYILSFSQYFSHAAHRRRQGQDVRLVLFPYLAGGDPHGGGGLRIGVTSWSTLVVFRPVRACCCARCAPVREGECLRGVGGRGRSGGMRRRACGDGCAGGWPCGDGWGCGATRIAGVT